MEPSSRQHVAELLRSAGEREAGSLDRLIEVVYPTLRQVAGQQLRKQGASEHGVTSLVNEAYVRFVEGTGVEWKDIGHFYAVAALTMRRILVDEARRRMAKKRGAGEVGVTLDEGVHGIDASAEVILAVDQALGKLEGFSPRLARVTECRFMAGLSTSEAAQALGVSGRTIERDWLRAQAWLALVLNDGTPSAEAAP